MRLSSYRWKNVQTGGVHNITMPGNYGWFLDHIEKHALCGWMDFMSNVVVGVDVSVIEWLPSQIKQLP